MELNESLIQQNKDRFLALVKSITRPGVDMERLVQQLENSDFFEAPASTKYHYAFAGGLCAHCLNVYDTLVDLVEDFYPLTTLDGTVLEAPSEDSIKIVSLFHDFDKMNKYTKYFRNEKVYSATGTKYDEMGKFDWVSVPGYKHKEDNEVFTLGSHGANSVYMTETFVPLSAEEHCAILNHSSVYDNPKLNVTGIYSKYKLACLLHTADLLSTYVIEG